MRRGYTDMDGKRRVSEFDPDTQFDEFGEGLGTACTGLTRVAGYPSQSTQADDWNGRLPEHYSGNRNTKGATRIGIGFGDETQPHKHLFRGRLQTALDRADLDEIVLAGSGLVIGADRKLYEPREGLIDCLAPVRDTGTPGSVYVNEVDWESFPPLDELAYLFDEFFSRYAREVLMIVGKRRDGRGWLYHVPRQEGSLGLVTWSATDGEMAWFTRQARWIGTIHVHPSSSCTPSSTDIDDWAEPTKCGLHVIFGRGGFFTINGAIAGRTFELDKGTLEAYERTTVEWTTSGRRPLSELLLQPKTVRVVHSRKDWTHFGNRNQSHMPIHSTPHRGQEYHTGEESDFVTWMFSQASALKIDQAQLGSMRVVFYQGSYYMMTLSTWLEMQEWGKDLVDLPKAKRLSIYPVKGGNC